MGNTSLPNCYKQQALAIDGLSKNSFDDLCRMYVACKGSKFENYILSSVLYKKWENINTIKNHMSRFYGIDVPEDVCYDIFIDSILYVLDKHVWDNPDSVLYKLPEAPTAALNTRVESIEKNYYRKCNQDKRAANNLALPFDDDRKTQSEEMTLKRDDLYSLVCKLFGNKRYIESFIIYCIASNETNVYIGNKNTKYQFNISKVVTLLKRLDQSTILAFSEAYDINPIEVTKAFDKYKKYPEYKLRTKIGSGVKYLKNNKDFSYIVAGGN